MSTRQGPRSQALAPRSPLARCTTFYPLSRHNSCMSTLSTLSPLCLFLFPLLLSEEQMLAAVELGHAAVRGMCVQMEAWAAQVGGWWEREEGGSKEEGTRGGG